MAIYEGFCGTPYFNGKEDAGIVKTRISPPGFHETQGCHLRYYSGANAFFNISLKIVFSICHHTLKQIAVGSPLGAANYIYLLQDAASLKSLGSTGVDVVHFFQKTDILPLRYRPPQLRLFIDTILSSHAGAEPCHKRTALLLRLR